MGITVIYLPCTYHTPTEKQAILWVSSSLLVSQKRMRVPGAFGIRLSLVLYKDVPQIITSRLVTGGMTCVPPGASTYNYSD